MYVKQIVGDEMTTLIKLVDDVLPDQSSLLRAVELALMDIRAKVHFEQRHHTGLHMTCLSLIERAALEALAATGSPSANVALK